MIDDFQVLTGKKGVLAHFIAAPTEWCCRLKATWQSSCADLPSDFLLTSTSFLELIIPLAVLGRLVSIYFYPSLKKVAPPSTKPANTACRRPSRQSHSKMLWPHWAELTEKAVAKERCDPEGFAWFSLSRDEGSVGKAASLLYLEVCEQHSATVVQQRLGPQQPFNCCHVV